jgi:rhamnogalacturonyl hydrolase YesR
VRTYTDVFLMRDTNLAKTVLLPKGLGNTYWTRASGWLLWSLVDVLKGLPESDPAFKGLADAVRRLADGYTRVQDASGGFHVLLDDPSTPLETTGAAMCAMGLHLAVRRGWIDAGFGKLAERAWTFAARNVTPEGKVRQVYTGWAMPAEKRDMSMDHVEMGWIPGFILSTACEMST